MEKTAMEANAELGNSLTRKCLAQTELTGKDKVRAQTRVSSQLLKSCFPPPPTHAEQKGGISPPAQEERTTPTPQVHSNRTIRPR